MKKLALKRETLISLDPAVLAGVAGGQKTAELITRTVGCPGTRTVLCEPPPPPPSRAC